MIARAQARCARLAVVVGAFKCHLTQDSAEGFGSAAGVASLLPAIARNRVAHIIGPISVERLLDGAGRYSQCLAPRLRLNRLKIQAVDRTRTYEPFDLPDDFRLEGFSEPPFLATFCEVPSAESSSASAHCSQACQYASTSLRNCRPASICCRSTSV